jgi:sulfate adenylyltransferase subunit 2
MNATPATAIAGRLPARPRPPHLDWLEEEAIFILREVAASAPRRCCSPAARTRCVLLRLAEKAFRPGRFPFPLLHIDTGHNFPEVIAFRDRACRRAGRAPDRALGRRLDRARHGAAGDAANRATATSR